MLSRANTFFFTMPHLISLGLSVNIMCDLQILPASLHHRTFAEVMRTPPTLLHRIRAPVSDLGKIHLGLRL